MSLLDVLRHPTAQTMETAGATCHWIATTPVPIEEVVAQFRSLTQCWASAITAPPLARSVAQVHCQSTESTVTCQSGFPQWTFKTSTITRDTLSRWLQESGGDWKPHGRKLDGAHCSLNMRVGEYIETINLFQPATLETSPSFTVTTNEPETKPLSFTTKLDPPQRTFKVLDASNGTAVLHFLNRHQIDCFVQEHQSLCRSAGKIAKERTTAMFGWIILILWQLMSCGEPDPRQR